MYKLILLEHAVFRAKDSISIGFRYVISNGSNEVWGFRCGTKKEVQSFVADSIKYLNEKYPPRKRKYVKPVYNAARNYYFTD